MNKEVRILSTGDSAITIYFKQEISEEINQQVSQLAKQLSKSKIMGVIEWVPAYASLTIYYNPLLISMNNLIGIVEQLLY